MSDVVVCSIFSKSLINVLQKAQKKMFLVLPYSYQNSSLLRQTLSIFLVHARPFFPIKLASGRILYYINLYGNLEIRFTRFTEKKHLSAFPPYLSNDFLSKYVTRLFTKSAVDGRSDKEQHWWHVSLCQSRLFYHVK